MDVIGWQACLEHVTHEYVKQCCVWIDSTCQGLLIKSWNHAHEYKTLKYVRFGKDERICSNSQNRYCDLFCFADVLEGTAGNW